MYLKRVLFLLGWLSFFSNNLSAQVTADFSANITEGCGSLAVSFSDLSSSTGGTITSWTWELGGVTVMQQQAGRIFPTGVHEVCLTVTDSNGNTDTECKTDYIKVFELPTADFGADVTMGCSPLEVVFEDLSTSANGEITQWIWGVGGTTGVIVDDGSQPSIENIYNIADGYDISLTITNEEGCVGTVTKTDFIMISPDPQLAFSANETFQCTPPFTVDFTNDIIEPNTQYTWDFGNGTTYVGDNPPAVTYTDPGEFDVQIIGMNMMTNCADTLTKGNYISLGNPVEFVFSQNEICAMESINFEDISEFNADSILWDFGDGTTSTEVDPSHQFATAGCFTVSLTRYEDGCATMVPSDFCIQVKPLPTANFLIDANVGCSVPHLANFSSSAPTAISYFWEFGEAGEMGTSTEQNPSLTFTELGIYPIFLTVTDAEGCSNTISSDTVRLIELNATLPEGQFKGCSPLTVTLTENSATVAPITDWLWKIDTPSGLLTSTDETPTFTIPDTGCYHVTLIVTNALGCRDSSIIDDVICGGMTPVINFDATPVDACINSDVSFSDLSDPFVNEWFWSFGDSTFAFTQNPAHEYVDTGTFDVVLIATHNSCSAQLTQENFIHTLGPKSTFSYERLCNDPYSISFESTAIDAEELLWDFGDPNVTTDTSSQIFASYTYPDTGLYAITLVAYNYTNGCTDTSILDYYITDPKSNFTFDVTEGCAPLTITPSNSSVFGDVYEWIVPGVELSDSMIAEPEMTFSAPGVYDDIQLKITDVNGCEDILDYSGTIRVNGITPDFSSSPAFGCNPLPVQFTDNSSSLMGNIISWDWNIGDSLLMSDLQNPDYLFDEVGTYPVTLTVTDDWNCENTIEVLEAINVTQPTAKFKSDTLGCTISSIKFINQSQGTGLTFQWSFGDGGAASIKNPNHTYTSEGVYTICLKVTDVNGCTDTFCRDDFVTIANPVAGFTSDTTSAACPPLIVNFENLSQNANTYEWNFGDGSGSSNLQNPPHVYTTPGIYDVSVIAIANEVCRDTFTIEEYINLDGPQGSFSFDYDNACIPTEVNFYAESNDFYTYIWDFGDGTLDTSGFRMTDTISHYYTQIFDYLPNLILVDNQGCVRPIPPVDTIALVALEVGFEASNVNVCNDNNPITFYNMTNSSVDIEDVQWIFEGGNPAVSTEFEPSVIYNMAGSFDVTLIVNNGFCADTLIKTDFINVGEMPTANFTMTPDEGCAPLPVTFTDISGMPTGFISEWEWIFENETMSNIKNPTHTFETGGEFPIQLKVMTNEGCMDSIQKMITVFPEIFFTVTGGQTICTGDSTTLSAEFISDTVGVNYYWKPDPTLSCTDCLNPSVNPMDTTTYTLVAVSPENCMYEKSVTINVRPDAVPVISISGDTTICANDVTQIFASGGDNIFGYDWDHAAEGLSCYDACNNPIASPVDTTTYSVTVTNLSGCSSSASMTVSVFYEYQNILGDDRTICLGDTVQLQIAMGNNPEWMISDGLNCSLCPNPIATPQETMSYVVKVESDFGCDIYDTITVNVLTEEDIDAGNDLEICIGQTAQLTGFGNGIPSWTPAATLNQTDIFNPIATPTVSTTYYFSLEYEDCILTDSVRVNIIQKTEIDLLDREICEGESMILQPIGFADSFQWSPPEGLSATDIKNPTASPTVTTDYTVVAQLGTCPADTATATLTVLEKPKVVLGSVYRFFPGETVLLDVEMASYGDFIYQWTPGGGLSCTDCANPAVSVENTTDYLVIVTDIITGCSSTEEVRVERINECSEELISMPNAFTPNGDGINDTYEVYTDIITDIDYFRVFNRWGAMVYETDNRYFKWDGRVNGKLLAEGVYIYVLSATCELDGSTILKRGDITIHQ